MQTRAARFRTSLWLALYGCVWLGTCALLPARGQATLVADTHVNAALPMVNSGAISNVVVGSGYIGLWQFDLSLLPAATTASQVSRAVLVLYPNRVDTAGSLLLSPITSAWSEGTVTASATPVIGSPVSTVNVGQAGSFVAVDVTDLVKGWISSPATNFGFALTSSSASVQFDSKENDLTSHPATLELTLVTAGPAGAAGPVGAAGPAGVAGPPGAPGPAGAAGIPGAAGQAGAVGATGPAGAQGLAGPQGPAGLQGAAGAAGASGAIGPQGAAGPPGVAGLPGAAGPQGIPGVAGSIGLAGATGPPGPPGAAGLAGTVGAMGPQGLPGSTGATGPAGPTGPQGNTGQVGPMGPAGLPGITFRGAWSGAYAYAVKDAVAFGGSTYIATSANSGVAPDQNASLWSLLAASGATGPIGATGTAATIQIGSVSTSAAGTSASVVNVGTASAAVLNFTLPQGVAGPQGGGSGSGSGGPGFSSAGSMVHAVSYAADYYSFANPNQSYEESTSVLTWVPAGCTATQLNVFSLQGGTITVTARVGTPGAMSDSALSCQVSTGSACSATGSVAIPAGGFVDYSVSHADSTPSSVWTALTCS